MYRVPAMAVLVAAAAFPPSLGGQMRPILQPSSPIHVNVPRFRVPSSVGRFGVMSRSSIGPQVSFSRRRGFGHDSGSRIFVGNSCFSDPFFTPLFCRQFFFPNRFAFAEPVFLPYPVDTAPYDQVAEQTQMTVADRESDLVREVERLANQVELLRAPQAAIEPVLLERQGERWVRITSSGQSGTGAQPNYSEESKRGIRSARKPAAQKPLKLPPVMLVFRDGHKEEVSSYIIVDGTMYTKEDYWTSGSWTKNIQIGDLDLQATLRLNQDRGVKFALPTGPFEVVMR
jgi:hypothetical protein